MTPAWTPHEATPGTLELTVRTHHATRHVWAVWSPTDTKSLESGECYTRGGAIRKGKRSLNKWHSFHTKKIRDVIETRVIDEDAYSAAMLNR